MPGTRKLGRTTDQRRAMLRAMVTFLLENGKIETTVTRAKEVAAMTEKMITLAKAGDLHKKRQVLSYVTKEGVAKKLFDEAVDEGKFDPNTTIVYNFNTDEAHKAVAEAEHPLSPSETHLSPVHRPVFRVPIQKCNIAYVN